MSAVSWDGTEDALAVAYTIVGSISHKLMDETCYDASHDDRHETREEARTGNGPSPHWLVELGGGTSTKSGDGTNPSELWWIAAGQPIRSGNKILAHWDECVYTEKEFLGKYQRPFDLYMHEGTPRYRGRSPSPPPH
jgi:hypothetical protein